MRSAARAIVLQDDHILLIKRFKLGKEYYTLPGGRVEKNETADQAAVREVKEESTIEVVDPRLVFIEEAGEPYGDQHIYLCTFVQGTPVLPADSEEAFWSVPGKNTYEPVWFEAAKLSDVNFVSPLLKEALVMGLKAGWPTKPYTFSAKHANRLS